MEGHGSPWKPLRHNDIRPRKGLFGHAIAFDLMILWWFSCSACWASTWKMHKMIRTCSQARSFLLSFGFRSATSNWDTKSRTKREATCPSFWLKVISLCIACTNCMQWAVRSLAPATESLDLNETFCSPSRRQVTDRSSKAKYLEFAVIFGRAKKASASCSYGWYGWYGWGTSPPSPASRH